MLTIGEFSRICFVSKKTLRHYDEVGLLRPEHIAENGYRYYTAAQLRTMLLISRLKGYGLSLPEIAAVLANPDRGLLAGRLREKRAAMEAQAEQTRRTLLQMEQDIGKLERSQDIMEHNIVVKTVELEPQTIFHIRKKMSVEHFSESFNTLFAEVERRKLRPMGPPLAFYHDEEFDAEHSDIEVAVPVEAGEGAEGIRTMPGGLHACATLVGPYMTEAFTATYAGLCEWIEQNGYRIASAPFDRYVRGGEGVDPKEYVTEIYFPIAR